MSNQPAADEGLVCAQQKSEIPPQHTQWSVVLLLFAAGCSVALHIGKVPSALPEIRSLWQLTLTQSGLIVSLYSLLIALSGLLLGVLVRRMGYVGFAIAGVSVVGVASVAGAFVQSLPLLLLTRAVEGFGWIVTVVAFPSLLAALSHPSDRVLVMGIWAAFVPLGAGTMLLLSPQLQVWGSWRLSWLVAGIVTLLAALLVWLLTRRSAHHLQHLQGQLQPVDLQDLKKPLVWLLSACFFFYSCQFTSVTSFLPSLMISTSSWHIETASLFTAMVIMSNAVGSIVAGALLRRGFGFCPILVAGALGMGISAYILFNADMPLLVRLTSAFGFSMVGGLLPGALFATLPQTATSPAIVGMLIGLMLQASGVGQLIGGVALPAVVEYFHSWQAAGILALAYSIAGSVAAASTNCFSAKHTRKE